MTHLFDGHITQTRSPPLPKLGVTPRKGQGIAFSKFPSPAQTRCNTKKGTGDFELCVNKVRHMYSWLKTWLKSLTGHSCISKMHYFQLPVKTQPDGPIPSDTDLRSFATECFASYFRDMDIRREARLPKVRQRESEFFAVSGRALWKLVLKRTELTDEDHFTAAFYESYKVDYLDEFLRRYGEVVYPEEWLEACRREY